MARHGGKGGACREPGVQGVVVLSGMVRGV